MIHRPYVLIVEDPDEPSGALEFVMERRPDLVLMQASYRYREGAEKLGHWRHLPGDTRLLFVDREGSWTNLLELPDPDTGTMRIFPCPTAEIPEILTGIRAIGVGVPAA